MVIKRHTRGMIRNTLILNVLVLIAMTANKELVVIRYLKCWFSFYIIAVLSWNETVNIPCLMDEGKNTDITPTSHWTGVPWISFISLCVLVWNIKYLHEFKRHFTILFHLLNYFGSSVMLLMNR